MIKTTALVFVVAVSMGTIGHSAMASASTKKHAAHVPTTKLAAAQFSHDDAPFAKARAAYATAFSTWYASKAPTSETTSFVDPFVAACQTFEHKLDSQSWPPTDRSKVRTFAASLAVVANDVARLPSVSTVASGLALATQFARDSAASEADSNSLRKALGLPALT
jgi:hypothetical protein